MVKTAVILDFVLPGKGVVAKSACEALGRILGVDVTLEGRVLVESCAALALVGLVPSLFGVLVEGGIRLKGAVAAGARGLGPRVDLRVLGRRSQDGSHNGTVANEGQQGSKKKNSPTGSRTLKG